MMAMMVVVFASYRDIRCYDTDLAVARLMGRMMDLDEFFGRGSMGGMSGWMMVVVAWSAFGCEGNPAHVSLGLRRCMLHSAGVGNLAAAVAVGYVREAQNDGINTMS